MDSSLKDNPVAASTPKRPQGNRTSAANKLVCQHCGKLYMSTFYFTKHVSSHTTQGSATNLNISVIAPTDPNDISFGPLRTADEAASFAVPTVPAAKKKNASGSKKKPHLICTYCLKGYICSRSFKSHIRAHHIQDAASRFPKVQLIIDNAVEIGNKAMSLVANSPSGPLFRELVGHVTGIEPSKWREFSQAVCTELVGVLRDKKCLLPSALASSLIDQIEVVLSDSDLRDKLMMNLGLLGNFSGNVIDQFYLEFCLKLMQEILKFIRLNFQDKLPPKPAKEINIDSEDRQVIYYIAGSIMRGFLKIARKSKKSVVWQNIAAALQTNVLIDKPVGDMLVDSEWTVDADRGGLLYINANCQNFL